MTDIRNSCSYFSNLPVEAMSRNQSSHKGVTGRRCFKRSK